MQPSTLLDPLALRLRAAVVRLAEGTPSSRMWAIGALAVAAWFALLLLEVTDPDGPLNVAEVLRDALEWGLLIGFGAAVAVLVLGYASRQEGRLTRLQADFDLAEAGLGQWRDRMKPHIDALASGVQQQFQAWGLSESEHEIALLLLKGLSFKEIATLRSTSEGTVRQQAASIYRKSKLGGRAAFSAFFFEDLLTPPTLDDARRGAPEAIPATRSPAADARPGNGPSQV